MASGAQDFARVERVGFTCLSEPSDAIIDIVFVHGLGGHPEKTWTYGTSSQTSESQSLGTSSTARRHRRIRNPFSSRRDVSAGEDSAEQLTGNKHGPASTQSVFWPRDLLKEDFPRARIMTFGYNTQVAQAWSAVNKGDIFAHAGTLLYGLEQMRRKAPNRDLVFIVHSLGGIIIKEVLRQAQYHEESAFKTMYNSTTGIFFFGTPHRGSDFASLGDHLAFISGTILGMDVNSSIVRELIPNGLALKLVRESFAKQWAARRSTLTVRTFQEGRALAGVKRFNGLVVNPESSSLDHESQHAVTLDANHIDMVKFRGRDHPGYFSVKSDLEQLVTNAEKVERVPSFAQDKRECLQILRISQYEQTKDRNPSRLDGTCQWVLKHENYRNWIDNRAAGILLITAGPGSGKSVLAKHLVDHEIKPSAETPRKVIYFFFKEDDDKQNHVTGALSALLHQLFSQNLNLIQYAMKSYQAEGERITQNFPKLWNIFTQAVTDSEAGEIVCVLDGLDECVEPGRRQLIDALSDFYKSDGPEKRKGELKVLATTRPYQDIERPFHQLAQKYPEIRVRGESESDTIKAEINMYVESEIFILKEELQLNFQEVETLREGIGNVEHRTYLWAKLIFDILHKTIRPTRKKLTQIVKNLPKTVDDAYERILSRICESDVPQARKLLSIVVTASRPLTAEELNVALAIELSDKSWDDVDENLEDEARFEATVKDLCGLFVTIADHKVYLIHQTAREFLLSEDNALQGWHHSLHPIRAELILATSCIVVLALPGQEVRKTKFYNYAAQFWTLHFEHTEFQSPQALIDLVILICDTKNPNCISWMACHMHLSQADVMPRLPNALTLAAYLGHVTVVKQLLAKGQHDQNAIDEEYGRTPLGWAVQRGHTEITYDLLETSNVNLEATDFQGRTPLGLACMFRKENPAILLLNSGAKPDYENADSGSALIDAVSMGLPQVVDWIVNHVSKETFQTLATRLDAKGNSILHRAIFAIDEKRSILLQPVPWQTVHSVAKSDSLTAAQRHKLLYDIDDMLKRSADRDQWEILFRIRGEPGEQDDTLSAHHRQGLRFIEILLEAGTNANLQQASGRTPLHIAVGRPDTANGVQLVKVLLRHTDPLIPDHAGNNILHVVLNENRPLYYQAILEFVTPETLRTLLTSKSKRGSIPLFSATTNTSRGQTWTDHPNCLKAMYTSMKTIILNAKINQLLTFVPEADRPQILNRFIETGLDELVEVVIPKLAHFDIKLLTNRDEHGRLPLIQAVRKQLHQTVQFLVDHRVDVNIQEDGTAKSALHFAVECNDSELVAMLIRGGARLDLRDSNGRTAAEYCASLNKCHGILYSTSDVVLPSRSGAKLANLIANREERGMICGVYIQRGSEWANESYKREGRYLVSEPVPPNAKLPVLKIRVVIEGRHYGFNSDESLGIRPEGANADGTRYMMAIVRDDQVAVQCEFARLTNLLESEHRFDHMWFSESEQNFDREFGGRRPKGEDDQGDFVRLVGIGDRLAIITTARVQDWPIVTTSARIEICFEE